MLSDEIDQYHPWYRYCFVKVSRNFYDRLGSPDAYEEIIQKINTVLCTYFSTEDFDETRIYSCICQAVEQGENMRMLFKEKTGAKRRAKLFLRYLDACRYAPILQVSDTDGHLLFETDLPERETLDYLGNIRLSAKRVVVEPRKNAFTDGAEALVFDY